MDMLAGILVSAGLAVAGLLVPRHPRVALPLLVVAIPFHKLLMAWLTHNLLPISAVGGGPRSHEELQRIYRLDALVVAAVLAGALLGAARRGRLGAGRPRLVALLLAGMVVPTIVAVSLGANTTASMIGLALEVAGPATALAVLWIGPDMATRRRMVWAAAAGASVLAAVAFVERLVTTRLPVYIGLDRPSITSAFYQNHGTLYRSGSLLGTPLELGFLLGSMLPIAVVLVLRTRGRQRGAALAIAALVLAGLLATDVRSGMLGALTGSLLAAMLTAKRRQYRYIGTAVAVTAVVGFVASTTPYLRSDDTESHVQALQGDIRLILHDPLGHGLGTIDTVGQVFAPRSLSQSSTESSILAVGVEQGVEGLLLRLLIIGTIVVALVAELDAERLRRRGEPLPAAAACGAMIALFISGFFLGMRDVSFIVPVWALAGAALCREPARVQLPLQVRTVAAPTVAKRMRVTGVEIPRPA